MTPKQKAEELFDKINELIPIEADFNDTAEKASLKMMKDHFATIKISLFVVDQMLNELSEVEFNYDQNFCQDIDFWKKVKEEINKI